MNKSFKKHLYDLTQKKLIFKLKKYTHHPYSFFIDYDNVKTKIIIKTSYLFNYIITMKPDILLFFSKHLNLKKKLFSNELKFPLTITPNNPNKEEINNHIIQMENVIKYLIKTEFQINNHLTFTKQFKNNLSFYRKNLTSLVNFLYNNDLKKINNLNCNSIMDVTPTSNKTNKNNKQCLKPKLFYGR